MACVIVHILPCPIYGMGRQYLVLIFRIVIGVLVVIFGVDRLRLCSHCRVRRRVVRYLVSTQRIQMLPSRTLLAVLLGAASMVPVAHAATITGSLNVSGVVEQKCLTTSYKNMTFTTYRTTDENNERTASILVTVRCVAGSTGVKLSFSQGLHAAPGSSCEAPLRRLRSTSDPTQYMSYNLYRDSSYSNVLGCAENVNEYEFGNVFTDAQTGVNASVYGRLDAGQDVFAGTYRDTITVNLTF